MRIGYLAPDLGHHHGWAHYSLETILGVQRAGIEVKVLAAHNSPLIEDLPMQCTLPSLAPLEPRLILKLAQCIPETRAYLADCDLVHSMAEPYAPLANWVRNKRPFVQGGIGSYLQIEAWQRFPTTVLYRQAISRSQLVCISHYSAQVAHQVFPNSQPEVVTLGVDTSRFDKLPPASEPDHTPTILTVGGVKKRKGTLELIRALPAVRDKIPDVRCVILGKVHAEEKYVAQVQSEIEQLGLSDCVYMPGFVSEAELLGWYQTADVFVLPSMNDGWKFEGFGLVHLEASAAGVPVIGTTNNGTEDAIVHGETGLLVNQDNVETELPDAILSILQHPDRAKSMGAAGKKYAQSQTWDHVAEQTIAIYERLLSG